MLELSPGARELNRIQNDVVKLAHELNEVKLGALR
jgi:hypothetical protein